MSSDSAKPAKEIWRFRIGVDSNGAICSLATSDTIWYFKESISFDDLINKYREVLDNLDFESREAIKKTRAPHLRETPMQPTMTYEQLKNEAKKMLVWMYNTDDLIFGAAQLIKVCGIKKTLIHGHLSKLTRVGVLERVSRGAYQKVFSDMTEEEWVADALKNIYAR